MRGILADANALTRLEKLGGEQLLNKMIDIFLERSPQRLDDACLGGRVGDLESISRAVHSLKSSAGNVGATEVRDLAQRIETMAENGEKDIVLPLLTQLSVSLDNASSWLRRERAMRITTVH